jgi:hypothetical protein
MTTKQSIAESKEELMNTTESIEVIDLLEIGRELEIGAKSAH